MTENTFTAKGVSAILRTIYDPALIDELIDREIRGKNRTYVIRRARMRKNALRSPEDRFWQHVDKRSANECWPWRGAKNPNGYGQFGRSAGDIVLAHRYSYEIYWGYLHDSLHVCHACDNPRCVNPRHLWQGTNKDNILDAIKKGRWKKPPPARGADNGNSKLRPADVEAIRSANLSYSQIADRYSISKSQVHNIKKGHQWTY